MRAFLFFTTPRVRQKCRLKDIFEYLTPGMYILIIGNGGREHAFAWKIKQSPLCKNLYVAPGNAGTTSIAINVPIAVDDFSLLGSVCIEKKIDLILVGPEVPLVKGIRNFFESD